MKKPKLPIKKILVTVIAVQVLSAGFFLLRGDLITQVLPQVGWFLLPITAYFIWQQRAQSWQGLRNTCLSPWRYAGVILLIFGLFALFLWQVGALSLTLMNPYLENADEVMVTVNITPKDLLFWCMHIAFSFWLLIGCMALGINKVKHDPQVSLLSTRFKKLSLLAKYTESLLLVSTLTAIYILTMLLILQLSKTFTVMLGYPQVNVPYMGVAVFILVMYLFNTFYQFSKRHRRDAKNPKRSLAYLLMRQMGFYLMAWAISIIVTLSLPDHFLGDLSAPLGTALLSPENYAAYWQLTVMVWALCCVPLLSMLLARYSSRLPIVQSSALIFLLPLSAELLLNANLLESGSFNALLNSALNYQFIPLSEETLLFKSSFLSIVAGFSCAALLIILKYCPEFIQAWLGIMPVHSGRRVLRLKTHMTKMFSLGIMLYVLYLMMGSIALAMVFAGYLFALSLYIILHLGQGLVMGLSLPKLQWKRGMAS